MCHARKERVLLIGTDQRITSGPAARTAAPRGRIHGCTRIVSRKGQILFPCTAGAVHTWQQWVKSTYYRPATLPSASPRLTDITDSRILPVLPVTEPLSLYASATLACSKGSG